MSVTPALLAAMLMLCHHGCVHAQPGSKPQADTSSDQAVAFEARAARAVEEVTGTNPWDLEAVMAWDGNADLDLRVSDPTQCEIGYDNRLVPSGGMLMEDIVPGCGGSSGPVEEMITYKLGGAAPGIYVVTAQVFSDCGEDIAVTLTVKLGGVEVFSEEFTLSGRGDERRFFVHAHRVNTVYGVKVDERGSCLEEGSSGPTDYDYHDYDYRHDYRDYHDYHGNNEYEGSYGEEEAGEGRRPRGERPEDPPRQRG